MSDIDMEIEKSMRHCAAILNDPILAGLRKLEVERLNFVVSPMRVCPGGKIEFIESDADRAARQEFERKTRERIKEINADFGASP